MPAGFGAATRCGSKPACRSTATSLSEEIDPLQAGLGFAVDLENRHVSRPRRAGCKIKQSPLPRVRVGLELAGKRVPREGYRDLARHGEAGRRGHQRHVLAHARQADRDGLRSTRFRASRAPKLSIDIRGRSRAGPSLSSCRFIVERK